MAEPKVAAAPLTRGRQQTAEQQARDLLERMGVEDAQSYTAGDIVELANVIADQGWQQRYHDANAELRRTLSALEAAQHRIRQDNAAMDNNFPPNLAASIQLFREDPEAWYAEWQRVHDFKVQLIERVQSAEAKLSAAARLIAQWREKLDDYERGSNKLSCDEAGQLSQCADDLARVLGEQP